MITYKINNIKHPSMVYRILSLYDSDGKCTRRLYPDRNDKKFNKVFAVNNEVKMITELGIKSFGKVFLSNLNLKRQKVLIKK